MSPHRLLQIVTLSFAVLLIVPPTLAQEDLWAPPEPVPETLDWIQLKSGEWLRGEIHLLRDKDLEFESDELDNLELDWRDVTTLRTARILTFGFDKSGTVTGTAVMQGGTIAIQTAGGLRELPRSDLLSIIAGKPTEWNFWSAKVSLGVMYRSGNTDQDDLNSLVLIRRQTTRTRLNIEYKGNYSRTNDQETVNNHQGVAAFDYLVSKGFYVTPLAGELYADKFQNIDLRGTLAAGVGYFIVRKSSLEWNVGLAGGYQNTSFVSVEPGESITEESGVVVPSTSLEADITKDLDLTVQLSSQVTVPDTDGTVYHAFLLLEYELTSLIDFDISLTWDRVQNPKADAEGNVPEKDDTRLAFGLGLDF